MNTLATSTTLPVPEPLGPGRDKAPSAPWLPWVAPSEPGGGSFISERNAGISPSSSDNASLTTALSNCERGSRLRRTHRPLHAQECGPQTSPNREETRKERNATETNKLQQTSHQRSCKDQTYVLRRAMPTIPIT